MFHLDEVRQDIVPVPSTLFLTTAKLGPDIIIFAGSSLQDLPIHARAATNDTSDLHRERPVVELNSWSRRDIVDGFSKSSALGNCNPSLDGHTDRNMRSKRDEINKPKSPYSMARTESSTELASSMDTVKTLHSVTCICRFR